MPTLFKLKFNDLTRRASFAGQPDWQELSNRISDLFCIPQHQVGVTYIDPENEEITLNTREELQDYYFSSYRPGDTIKFSICDLISRNQVRLACTNAGHRNTSSQFIDPEVPGLDDWQAVFVGNSSFGNNIRSAFVESVSSDESTAGIADNTSGMQVEDAHSEVAEKCISNKQKGKRRAHSVSSNGSLVAVDSGNTYPNPIIDINSRPSLLHNEGGDTIVAESTPRVPEKEFDRMREFEDPPLPSVESVDPQPSQPAEASASLAQDITSFLNTISIIISAHPELGDSFRTIIRNVTNGTYWVSSREALSQAATGLQRNTENLAEESRRVVEEEAGRRIAQALSGMLRIFSQSRDEAPEAQANRNAQMLKQTTEKATRQPKAADIPPLHNANPEPTDLFRQQIPPMQGASMTTGFATYSGRPLPSSQGTGPTWGASISRNFAANSRFPTPPTPNSPFGTGILNVAHTPFGIGTAPFCRNNFECSSGLGTECIESQQRLYAEEIRAKVGEVKRVFKAEKVKAEEERYRWERDERKEDRNLVKSTA